MNYFARLFQKLAPWFFSHGVRIVLILLGSFLLNAALQGLLKKAIKKQIISRLDGGRKKRLETLVSVLGGTTRFVIYIAAILMVLSELGVNIAPILAGLGVAGLAVGMAARDVISDFIAGFFIILESQYELGDRVKIAGIEGEVKEITLRRTIIHDESELSHSIPNSQIKLVSRKIK